MSDMNELRESVRRSLPEVLQIKNEDLREKVIEAWALSLSRTEYKRIEDIPPRGNPGTPSMRRGTQADHIRGVALMAMAMAAQLEDLLGPIGIDPDILLAAGLCHDVGKPFEFDPSNQARWKANPGAVGLPSIRHSVYGVHIALTVGLPEAVAHAAGAHSGEGDLIVRSLENTLVHFADYAFWSVLDRAGMLQKEEQ
jgi:putative nucleotidyltransferase with HDIG domain